MESNKFYNSLVFLEYIYSNGFNPNNYPKILELFQSANGSLSQHLAEYDQYLLSRKVVYDELDSKGINGAYGYLDKSGNILVPKSFINDERFLYDGVKRLYKKHSYGAPIIDEFSVIIGCGMSNDEKIQKQELAYSLIMNPDISQYFGFCIEPNETDNSKQLIMSYYNLVQQINDSFGKGIYTFEHDTSKGKELCLIKRGK